MRRIKVALLAVAVLAAVFAGTKVVQACCGQLVDIYKSSVAPDIISPCLNETAKISGEIYEYYWANNLNLYPMAVTITVTPDGGGAPVRTFSATMKSLVGPTQSYGVDDDGDGKIDEDPGWPVAGVDDDADGRVDEDGGVPGDEYAVFSFSGAWDGKNDSNLIVPKGTYVLTIKAQAGNMGSDTIFAKVVTVSEEPCCVPGCKVNLTPTTINKERAGVPVTAHVIPPPPYVPASVMGGRIVSVAGVPVSLPSFRVGTPDLDGAVVQFDSAQLIKLLPAVPVGPSGHGKPGRVENVTICVEFQLSGGVVGCPVCDNVDVTDQ